VPAALTLLLAACASDGAKEAAQPGHARPAEAPGPALAARPVAPPAVAANPLDDPGGMLSKRSVFYAYDQYDVPAEYRPLVEAHAAYLRDHSGATVVIQGNCDERGSREYNLALGQRRAEGVAKLMTLLGARSSQVEAVSFGEEKPRATGHDESSWAQDRRSDIVYGRTQ